MERGAYAYAYGNGLSGERRRWLHKRLQEMTDEDELPTTVSSLYYDGLQSGRWPSDAEVKAAGGKRVPRQDVSDAVQWLIDHGMVDPDALVDFSRRVLDYRNPTDLLSATYAYARRVGLSPWDGAVPVAIVESRSIVAALDAAAEAYSIILAPLSGQVGRTHLRQEVATLIADDTPIAYLGDWNPSGFDIETNVHVRLTALVPGWRGSWTLLAVTDDDADRLPRMVKTDGRYNPPRVIESVEAEALTTTVLRRRLTDWLDGLLPSGFDWEAHAARTSTARGEVLRRLDERPHGTPTEEETT